MTHLGKLRIHKLASLYALSPISFMSQVMQEFTHIFHLLITLKCQCIAMVCAMVKRALLSIWNNWMVKLKANQKSKVKQFRHSWNSGQSSFCKETFLQLKIYFASSWHLEWNVEWSFIVTRWHHLPSKWFCNLFWKTVYVLICHKEN